MKTAVSANASKTLPTKYLIILEHFYYESLGLSESCDTHLKGEKTKEDGVLFAKGTLIYDKIDPMVERGLVATARLLILNSQTIAYIKIIDLLKTIYSADKKKLKKVIKYENDFNKFTAYSIESFDRYWNVSHLHIDLKGERWQKHFNIQHSCMGVPALSELYLNIEKLAQMSASLSEELVKPVLIEKEMMFE